MLPQLPIRSERFLLALLALLLVGLIFLPIAQASHLRAGDIQVKSDTTAGRNPRRFFFKMILYTQSSSPADAYKETIFFGDGTSSGLGQIVRSINPTGGNGTPIGNDTDVNIFYFEHTYNAVGTYTVSYIGEYRNDCVINMTRPETQTFYIRTTFVIDPALGINRSPVLTAPAVDLAARGQVFLHNPAAYDADGDSLAYVRLESQQVPLEVKGTISPPGTNQPLVSICTDYVYPDAARFGGTTVAFAGNPSGSPDAEPGKAGGGPNPGGNPVTFTQNKYTGQIVWNAPNTLGCYNVAFVVEEWRRVPGAPARRIGQVVRDMQIIVRASTNLRPTVIIPTDTCVVAGTPFKGNVTATDPENQPITLAAYSGIIPPATFRQLSNSPANRARGVFNWTPTCANISNQPTQVVFKATDQPPAGVDPFIDEKVWRITVVGPAPTGLVAQQNATIPPSVTLRWNRYLADCTGRDGIQLLIFRKEGCTPFTPDACQTGLPASLGYVQVGSVAKDTQQFIDTKGLERGKSYSYRIYATFPLPGGGASLASIEACVNMLGKSALLKNVTVDQTSTTVGAITVRWTAPKTGLTADFPTPSSYRLSRAVGQSTSFTSVFNTSNLADTSYVDTGLNTQANAYTYQLEFFVGGTPGQASAQSEATQPASSVRLSAAANLTATQVNLSWIYNVPWSNAGRPTRVYRRDPTPGAQFVQIATVTGGATGGSYVDAGTSTAPLQKGQSYCYYVQTEGGYGLPGNSYLNTLINLSQQQCVVLAAIPCPPVLTLVNNCDSLNAAVSTRSGVFPRPGETYTNHLHWTLDTNAPAGCATDIAYYRLFYRPADQPQLTLLDSTRGPELNYNHTGLLSQAACYQVQAVDVRGQRSALSAEVCVDNCQLFVLPNIFTPNGDGINDTFRPKVSSPLRRVHFTAFNRWGVKVYESRSNPLIDWSGEATNTEGAKGGKVSDGLYYYQAEVEFADLNGTKKIFKGWVQINH
ncbi:gliding motility-associated C-terminal domain-containing protein [Hymenobacter sp. GOD-10R]|uniref:gliding motility-associated C-terminal domain-containing protein n=1 Tax=Hymenobacter sp. GOD-10R TaxID=3093922 RepID=UPI002D76DE0C|nr:gliding motility-associated C-terminal domain-containing protein [Hymenobacter sp. GOD-10R]WRQ27164.1 gliding motility-associated C-terminal domain-containing protein [Hymenobacter sp. GOD-10R]